jgi:hypothetical protein
MDLIGLFESNQKEFLAFLKSKYQLYHLSNVFFRDIHYGVMAYLEYKGMKQRYTAAEEITSKVIESLEKKDILRRISRTAWMLNYPEFKKPAVKPAAPAKPAAAASPKPAQPAAAAAPQSAQSVPASS